MAKQRHQESDPGSSRNALIILVAGVLVVGALVTWALTRTVEVSPPPAEQAQSADGGTPGLTDTAARNTPPVEPLGTPPLAPPHVEGDRHEVQRISAEDMRSKWNRGEITVIDVRDEASFESGHIAGALHMPFSTIEGQIDLIPKGKPIVLYCT
jgi:hypothetical protein